MQLQVTQTAIIKCSITGNQYEIDPHTIDIQLEYTNNRAMGPENVYNCIAYHEELGEISWTVHEYPQGVINLIDSNLNDHTELVPPQFEFVEENESFFSDDELKTIIEFNEIVENIPTTVQFNITPDDKIDISEKPVDYNNNSLKLFATLQETTQTVFNVCAGLNNTHPKLFQYIENYYNTVQLKNETPSLYKIISSGDFLINYLEITKKHENDETSMGLDKEGNLNTLITAHYDFVKSTKEGKEVLANRNNNDKDSITPIVYNITNTNILSNNSQQLMKEIPNQSLSVGQHILRHISTELIKYSISCIFKYIAMSTNTLDFIPHILLLLERIMPYIDTLDFKYKDLLFKVYDIIKKFKK